MDNYGRSRESIAELDGLLAQIFSDHPQSQSMEEDKIGIPVRYLPDIFKSLDQKGLLTLDPEQEATMAGLISQFEETYLVESGTLLSLVAQLSKSVSKYEESALDDIDERVIRGRPRTSSTSSNSSSGSNGTSRYPSRPPSRSGQPPPTPTHPQTPLDKRQRSTPLSANPPSAYQRRPPPHRRKSDASPGRDYSSGGGGDSDGTSGSARSPRSRAGSQSVTTPSSSSTVFPSSAGFTSPTRDRFLVDGSSSPEDNTTRLPTAYDFADSISRIPMPRPSDSDDEDDEHDGRGSPDSIYTHLVFDPETGTRSTTSSTASLLPEARLDALTRANKDLAKRLQETEQSTSKKLGAQEQELEELELQLDELRTELARSKREEKELRAKERSASTQINSLESEIARLAKELSTVTQTYQGLQKQYAEQLALSERYRQELRDREATIRALRELDENHGEEMGKMTQREKEWVERVSKLEREVEEARDACTELAQQKIQNIGLKETIDRMRFEMDEMRNTMTSGLGTIGMPGSGINSRANTISKSLGAELQSRLEQEEKERTERGDTENTDTEGEDTVVEESVDDTDEEGNIVTTIIKRTRRKVTSRAQTELPTLKRQYSGGKVIERRIEEFEDDKEYADCAIQYDPLVFFDPESDDGFLRSASLQTDAEPAPVERLMAEIDIQTEAVEKEEEATTSTPTIPTDEPPAYPGPSTSSQAEKVRTAEEEREKEEQAELAILRKWHHTLQGRDALDVKDVFMHSSRGTGLSIPKTIMKDWARVQRTAGVDCGIVERLLAAAAEDAVEEEDDHEPSESRLSLRRLSNRIPSQFKLTTYIPQSVIYGSLSLIVGVVLAPHIAHQMNDPYGGANYYDRRAWASFNNLGGGGEGFGGGAHGGAEGAVWRVLEAIVGGGARYARGMPT
ncbi:hypothetical protein BDP27DRAFT_1441669 [Rhodocollybia butyracea]|uniref:Uncharacterized protein n=1 Tax=Rhodocollybia butyracea TaxID=206335 RepID=A0A9P5UFT4_9AGAR|nr:hypothetical protein BDP27DRAFT_1441669 [Rhodocollybia butyracea]